MDGSVSGDDGGSVSGDRVLDMSRQAGYVKSGVGGSRVRGVVNGNTVMSIVRFETGRGRLKIWSVEIFESFIFFIFFCGWYICGVPVG